jgi:hypothetical protein
LSTFLQHSGISTTTDAVTFIVSDALVIPFRRYPMREISALIGLIISVVLIAGCAIGPGYSPQSPTPTVTLTPSIPITTFPTLPASVSENISENWAGYVVQTSFAHPKASAIEAVDAVWNVPTVDCSGIGASDYASAFWVGIDGFSSSSVEQIGTDSDCVQGTAVYYAWYELYPKDSVTLGMTLTPGDEVHAKITYMGNQQFQFSLNDTTNAQSVTITETSTIAQRVSAEWIAEAPVYRHHILSLSEFGPVDFLNASVTINGRTGPIDSDQWKFQTIVMEAVDGTIKATPSDLVNGNSFSIIWEHR